MMWDHLSCESKEKPDQETETIFCHLLLDDISYLNIVFLDQISLYRLSITIF